MLETEACKVLDVSGKYGGLYEQVGTYNGRGDYYTEDTAYNIFFERVEAVSTTATNSAEGSGGNRRLLAGAIDDLRSRTLAACDTGYWIKTPTGGGYPFYAVRR